VLLEVDHVTKEYRRGVRANDDVSFRLDGGQVLGLLGHNGAGKTTLLNQVVGLARPTAGSIRIDGGDAVADPAMARRRCSLQPQSHAPLDAVTPRQAIEIMARIRGAGRRRARERADELLAALDLQRWAGTPGERLSGGVRRLTAFCMAAAEPGRVVMFDEPTNDVDPTRRRLLWRQVRALADAGRAVVLVTHNVVEAERVMDRLVILDRGRVVAEGTPARLRAAHGDRLRFEVAAADPDEAARLAADLAADLADAVRPGRGDGTGDRAGADAAAVAGRRVVAAIDADAAASAIAWARRHQAAGTVDEFSITPISLEDIYITLVRSEQDHGSVAA
jgi:ABC-2 type transport system ATP-binding protein